MLCSVREAAAHLKASSKYTKAFLNYNLLKLHIQPAFPTSQGHQTHWWPSLSTSQAKLWTASNSSKVWPLSHETQFICLNKKELHIQSFSYHCFLSAPKCHFPLHRCSAKTTFSSSVNKCVFAATPPEQAQAIHPLRWGADLVTGIQQQTHAGTYLQLLSCGDIQPCEVLDPGVDAGHHRALVAREPRAAGGTVSDTDSTRQHCSNTWRDLQCEIWF